MKYDVGSFPFCKFSAFAIIRGIICMNRWNKGKKCETWPRKSVITGNNGDTTYVNNYIKLWLLEFRRKVIVEIGIERTITNF